MFFTFWIFFTFWMFFTFWELLVPPFRKCLCIGTVLLIKYMVVCTKWLTSLSIWQYHKCWEFVEYFAHLLIGYYPSFHHFLEKSFQRYFVFLNLTVSFMMSTWSFCCFYLEKHNPMDMMYYNKVMFTHYPIWHHSTWYLTRLPHGNVLTKFIGMNNKHGFLLNVTKFFQNVKEMFFCNFP